MNKEQANSDTGEDGLTQDSDQMLPAVLPQNETPDAGQPVATDNQTIPTARSLVTTPEEASDSDLIEKEWVLKAKQIVEHTAEDPFTQQEELNKMKSDYLKKRYNKDIGPV